MGSGKTTRIIDQINKHPERHFIIIVERQTEVDRLAAACPNLISLSEVSEELNIKRIDALELVASEGKSMVSTHQLFTKWSDNFLNSVSDWEYELIMDETVSDILSIVPIKIPDLNAYIEEKFIGRCVGNKFNKVKLLKPLLSKYGDVEDRIKNKDCYLFDIANDIDDPHYQLIQAPRSEMFTVFQRISVLTYQFKGSLLRCYFDLHGINYQLLSIKDGEVISYKDELGLNFKDKINIYFGKLNHEYGRDIGSRCWTEKPNNQKVTKKRLRNIFNHWKKEGITPEDFLYTTHKSFQKKVHPSHIKGLKNKFNDDYADTHKRKNMTDQEKRNVSYLSQTIRGTNDFSHKRFLAYMSNTFMDPQIRNFLAKHDVQIDEDSYALNRMIQWLWRGCIRNDEEMHVFVPSKRMRQLLVDWLDGKPIYSKKSQTSIRQPPIAKLPHRPLHLSQTIQ